jgi:hypothetical protein
MNISFFSFIISTSSYMRPCSIAEVFIKFITYCAPFTVCSITGSILSDILCDSSYIFFMSYKDGCIRISDRWLLGFSSLMHLKNQLVRSCIMHFHTSGFLTLLSSNLFVAVQEAQILTKD